MDVFTCICGYCKGPMMGSDLALCVIARRKGATPLWVRVWNQDQAYPSIAHSHDDLLMVSLSPQFETEIVKNSWNRKKFMERVLRNWVDHVEFQVGMELKKFTFVRVLPVGLVRPSFEEMKAKSELRRTNRKLWL